MMSDARPDSPLIDGVCFVERNELPSQAIAAVQHGAAVASIQHAVIEITGSGAIQCIQGLVTADIDKPGDRSFRYGALLTAKGMIVSDMWIARQDPLLILYVARSRKDEILTTLKRSLPPRLARFADRSDDQAILRVAGPRVLDVAARAGVAAPQPGKADVVGHVAAARPALGYPFVLQYSGDADSIGQIRDAMVGAGAVATSDAALHLPRILSGWPYLEAEIDNKTLPQEVRFDDIQGVSHSKGCYLGQETVARIHFRGHTNRRVLGLRFNGVPSPGMNTITQQDRNVGRVTSIAWFGSATGYLGLGMIRREVEVGQTVSAGGVATVTTSLPLDVAS